MATHRQTGAASPASGPEKKRPRRVVTSLELMGNGNELIIEHAGEEYRLRITKQEKLILTK